MVPMCPPEVMGLPLSRNKTKLGTGQKRTLVYICYTYLAMGYVVKSNYHHNVEDFDKLVCSQVSCDMEGEHTVYCSFLVYMEGR